MNSTKREYVTIGNRYPELTGTYLSYLETLSAWDLRKDIIYIVHSNTTYDFLDVSHYIYSDLERGGEVIHEILDLTTMPGKN